MGKKRMRFARFRCPGRTYMILCRHFTGDRVFDPERKME